MPSTRESSPSRACPALAAGPFPTSTAWEALAPVGSTAALRLGDDGLSRGGGAEGEESEQVAGRRPRDQKARTTVPGADRLRCSEGRMGQPRAQIAG